MQIYLNSANMQIFFLCFLFAALIFLVGLAVSLFAAGGFAVCAVFVRLSVERGVFAFYTHEVFLVSVAFNVSFGKNLSRQVK